MLSKLKDIATTTAWLTVGVTAITVEHIYKAGKNVHNEVKAGMPQELVKYHIDNIKSKVKSNPTVSRVRNPRKEILDQMQAVFDKQYHANAEPTS
tara:strand:- start:99 stop:383 length:285 start_codon:yes stop_codon:yes gene_type:complete